MAIRSLSELLGQSGGSGTTSDGSGTDTGSGSGTVVVTEETSVFEMAPAEMLTEVNRAIYNILVGGQSYRIGSRQLTRADLATLRSLRAELEAETAAEEDDNGLLARTYAAVFDRPR